MSKHSPVAWQSGNPAVGLGMQLAVGMAVFAGGGYWLDRRRGGGVLFTLLGVGLGLLYGGYEVWKTVRAINASAQRESDKRHDVRQ